jgi:flagellar protein FlgJ
MTKNEFLAVAIPAARAASLASGFPAGITVAQAALESDWGRSRLAIEAHNYFGIKAHGAHPWVEFTTTEVAAAPYTTRARFARYASMAECFADRDALLLRARCYAEARAAMGDPVAFTRALATRWATDPRYAEKVLTIYRAHGLDDLDRKQ